VTPACWIDGQPAEALPLTDRGLHYGDGLFETLAVREGRIRHLDMHLDRLWDGCRRLGMPALDAQQLRRELDAAASGQSRAVMKLMVTRGSGGRGYRPPAEVKVTRVLLRYPWPEYPAEWAESGIEARICNTRLGSNPALAGIKHLNRLEQVLARAEWGEGAAEGLMLDADAHVIEGTMTNVFASRQGLLVTPALDQAGVAGVTRRHILESAERAGIRVGVRRLSLDEFLDSEEIFVCNTIAGVWPVNCIGTRRYPVGDMARLARQWAAEG